MTFFLALIFLVLIVLFSSAVRQFDTYYSVVSVLGLASFIYLVGIPIEIEITGNRYLNLADQHPMITEATANHVIVSAILGYTLFFVGYIVTAGGSTRRFVDRYQELQAGHNKSHLRLSVICAVAAVGVLVVFLPNIIAARDYAANVAQSGSDSLYSFAVSAVEQLAAMSVVLIGLFGRASVTRIVLLALPLIAWGLYSNDKDPLLLAVLALACVYLRKSERYKSVWMFATTVVCTIFAMFIAVLFFSIFRGRGSYSISEYFQKTGGVLTSLDPAGPFYSIIETINTRRYDYGSAILQDFTLWIPKFIWGGRPDGLAVAFARTHMADWSPGKGYGYSPIAEGYIAAGDFGVVMLFFLMGVVFGVLRRYLMRVTKSVWVGSVNLGFMAVVLPYVAFVSLRGPFYQVVTSFVHAAGLYAVLYACGWFLDRRAVRVEQRAAVQWTQHG